MTGVGWAVAVSGDIVVLGGVGEDDGPGDPLSAAGAAYVFERNQGGTNNWGEMAKLVSSDLQSNDSFGNSVAVSGDTIVVAARYELGGLGDPLHNAGAAYVFERNEGGAGNWGETAKLTASHTHVDFFFGESVGISGDTIVVGATGDAVVVSGAAYVFERNQGGAGNWGKVIKVTASDLEMDDLFGRAIAISGDTFVVGSPLEDGGPGDPLPGAGAAYVFERNQGGAGNWGEVAKLIASDAAQDDFFGRAIGVNEGGVILVGAGDESGGPGDPIPLAGTAYVYCVDDDLEENDSFPAALSVSPDFFTGLQICGTDDYYAVSAQAGSTLNISTYFTHAAGDLDLALYDASQNHVSISQSVTDDENIEYVVPEGGIYYIRA